MANQERDNTIYDMLKWSHADLTKELNFAGTGKTADEIYRKLKVRIVDEYYAALQAQARLRKTMWICIAVTVAWFFLGALLLQPFLSDGAWAGSILVLIGLIVIFRKWARSYESKFQAYRDFDEDFFGGEIFYKLSRGIKF